MDITLHGERFILAEFGIGTPAILAVGYYLLVVGPFFLGLYLFLTGINYLPLLGYAIITVRRHSAKQDVEQEMSQNSHYVRKYSVQQLLIFVPFAILALAVAQRLKNE